MAAAEVSDRVVFVMPCDRELQFPALAIMQAFVREYDRRMQAQDASDGKFVHRLSWAVRTDAATLEYFRRAGNALEASADAVAGTPDAVIDFSDARLLAFRDSGKNCWQVCNILSGCQTLQVMPELRRVKPAVTDIWRTLEKAELNGECLFDTGDGEITGIVARASPATYLAAAMGLGVVEIIPEGRPSNWMAKWAVPFYRAISEAYVTAPLILRAQDSIARDMQYLHAKEAGR